MSNFVDILVVGGPHNGVVLCQPRPVPATIEHEGTTYTTEIYADVYRIARFDPDDDSDVAAAITAAYPFGAAWDLL